MKATELRIGNLIFQLGQITTIENISRSINDWERVNNKRLFDCTPIPITEEWLLKFGFTLYPSGSYCIDLFNTDNYLAFDIKYNKGFVYLNIETESIKIDCHYVHQLQNLYFALTGEELTI